MIVIVTKIIKNIFPILTMVKMYHNVITWEFEDRLCRNRIYINTTLVDVTCLKRRTNT